MQAILFKYLSIEYCYVLLYNHIITTIEKQISPLAVPNQIFKDISKNGCEIEPARTFDDDN